MLAVTILKELGLKDLHLKINSVGCPKCRPQHRAKLQDYSARIWKNCVTTANRALSATRCAFWTAKYRMTMNLQPVRRALVTACAKNAASILKA